MRPREHHLVWLRDLLQHLEATRQRLEWVEDSDTVALLLESMLRDLTCCRQVCEHLKPRGQERSLVGPAA